MKPCPSGARRHSDAPLVGQRSGGNAFIAVPKWDRSKLRKRRVPEKPWNGHGPKTERPRPPHGDRGLAEGTGPDPQHLKPIGLVLVSLRSARPCILRG